MATLSPEFKEKIANSYLRKKEMLDGLDPEALESFASELLTLIAEEKDKAGSSHDLEVLEQSIRHLKQDSVLLKNYHPNTDDYDFTRSDCRNLLNSTKMWLKSEGLI